MAFILIRLLCDNSLCPSDAIWRHRSGSTLAPLMACCLMVSSHYLNQCWLNICEAQWHECNFTITEISSKVTYLNFHSTLPGAIVLMPEISVLTCFMVRVCGLWAVRRHYQKWLRVCWSPLVSNKAAKSIPLTMELYCHDQYTTMAWDIPGNFHGLRWGCPSWMNKGLSCHVVAWNNLTVH